jgi:hypothetical protein
MRAPIFSRGSPMGDVIPGQKAPLGRILYNFRLHMRRPKGIPKGSSDLWLLPVAMLLVLLYYLYNILYYYYSKKKTPGMRRTYFRSRDFR